MGDRGGPQGDEAAAAPIPIPQRKPRSRTEEDLEAGGGLRGLGSGREQRRRGLETGAASGSGSYGTSQQRQVNSLSLPRGRGGSAASWMGTWWNIGSAGLCVSVCMIGPVLMIVVVIPSNAHRAGLQHDALAGLLAGWDRCRRRRRHGPCGGLTN